MKTTNWYAQLKKPSWAPPAWLFGPAWMVLYILIAISYGYVFILFFRNQISLSIILPFILNLIFNFSFTPIQFGLRSNLLAALDIILIWGSLVWTMIVIFPLFAWVGYLQIPYLLWVSFATSLQITITFLNRKTVVD